MYPVCECVITLALCAAGTPGSEGTPVTPSSTPRAPPTTDETRQIKTEPETHSLYTHHSPHTQVQWNIFDDILGTSVFVRIVFTPLTGNVLHTIPLLCPIQISALPAYMAAQGGAIPLKMSPGGHNGPSSSKAEPWNNLILA